MTPRNAGDQPQPADLAVSDGGGDGRTRTLLDDLVVVGIGWRSGSRAVSRYVLPRAGRGPALVSLFTALRAREMFYLATCNRVEVVLLRCSSLDPKTLESDVRVNLQAVLAQHRADLQSAQHEEQPVDAVERWTVRRGTAALSHLARVAAGLDSALVGEREIRRQLRDALRESQAESIAGAALERVTSGALRIANRVHEATHIGDGKTSLAEIALDEAASYLAEGDGRVALVGISEMTRRCAERLVGKTGLVLVNRSLEAATELAGDLAGGLQSPRADGSGVETRSLEQFLKDPGEVSVVISAVATDRAPFDRQVLTRLKGAVSRGTSGPALIDFGVPPNIDPDAARSLGLTRFGMDEISERAAGVRDQRDEQLALANGLIEEGVEAVRRQLAERSLSPVLRTLSERYRDTAVEGLEEIFASELHNLDGEEREALLAWAERLARRLAHIPILGLRGLAAEAGNDAVTTFLKAADPSLLRSLRTGAVQASTETEPDD